VSISPQYAITNEEKNRKEKQFNVTITAYQKLSTL